MAPVSICSVVLGKGKSVRVNRLNISFLPCCAGRATCFTSMGDNLVLSAEEVDGGLDKSVVFAVTASDFSFKFCKLLLPFKLLVVSILEC